MTRRGLILLDRSVMEHELFSGAKFSEREAWIWMLMEASFVDRRIRIHSKLVPLKKGQFAASIRFMADKFQWNKNKVHRFLDMLEQEDMIGTETGTGQTIITICNYSEYQDFEIYRGTEGGTVSGTEGGTESGTVEKDTSSCKDEENSGEANNIGTASGTPDGTGTGRERDGSGTGAGQTITPLITPLVTPLVTKDINTPKEQKNAKREERLSDNWKPDAKDREYAKSKFWTDAEIEKEAENFLEHYTNGKGRKEKRPEWSKSWQTWVRNNYGKNGNNPTEKRRQGLAVAFAGMEVQRGQSTANHDRGAGLFAGCVDVDLDAVRSEGGDGDA